MHVRLRWAWLVVVLLVPRVGAAPSPAAQAEADKGVVVGGWTLQREWSAASPKPVWHGHATAPGAEPSGRVPRRLAPLGRHQVGVAIGAVPVTDMLKKDWHEIQLMDIGTVHVVVRQGGPGPVQQITYRPPPGYCIVERIYIYYEGDQVVELTESALYKGTLADGLKQAIATMETSPAADLMRRMVFHPVLLQTMRVGEDSPKLEVSVDDAAWEQLPAAAPIGGWRNAWRLPLRPGQGLKVRLSGFARTVKATTAGFVPEPGSSPVTGKACWVFPFDAENRWPITKKTPGVPFGPDGTATVDCGVLADARMLSVLVRDWGGPGRSFIGTVYRRWGRPEEKWLDTGDYPLEGAVPDPTPAHCISAMLSDLESAYNPDFGAWFGHHGLASSYAAGALDAAALRGLDLASTPRLAALVVGRKEIPGRRLAQFCSYAMAFDRLPAPASWEDAGRRYVDEVVGRQGGGLAKPLVDGDPASWHVPSKVCGLALIWQALPDLRDRIPLESILDFWADSIPKQPLPTVDPVLGVPAPRYNFEALAHAVVALHVGWQQFHKPQYAAARDALLAEIIRQESSNGRYSALLNKRAWCSRPDHPEYDSNWRPMLGFVSDFGQTCAFVGNDEGLHHAQDWVKAALTREGPADTKAYRSYRTATFADRCALIAVLRGLSPMYELPVAGQRETPHRLVSQN